MSFADDFDAAAVKPGIQIEDISNNPAEVAKYANYARVEIAGVPGTKKSFADAFDTAPASAVASPQAAPQAKQDWLTEQLPHALGLTARAGVTGLSALPNMLGDGVNSLLNMIPGVNLQLPSEATQQLMDKGGVSKPENGRERFVQGITSSMAGVSPTVQLGKLLSSTAIAAPGMASAIGNGLASAPGMQMVSAGAASTGQQLAADAGAGIAGQTGAGLLGAMLGAGASSGATSAVRKMMAPSKQQQLAKALSDIEKNNAPADKPRYKLNTDGSMSPAEPTPTGVKGFEVPEETPNAITLSTERQLHNIDVMRAIGLNEQRPSAISGNKHTAGTEFQVQKLSNDMGQVTRDQLQKEQDALRGYAQKIQSDTGATATSPEQQGQIVRAPMRALSDHYDNEIQSVYNEAKTNAGQLGKVEPDTLHGLLGDNNFRENFLSSPAGTTLLGSIDRQVKRFSGLPIEGEELAAAPSTVNSAENLRKWLNAQWSPGNSRLIGQVKEALDADVANAGGAGLFDKARALHAERKNTLDNPNGIAKLLTSDGPDGINQAIPDEHVTGKMLSMPTGQFQHILETLKSLPEPLQPQGQQAIAEIRAAAVKRIYEAGDRGVRQNGPSVWNAGDVTRALEANKSKLQMLFDQDTLNKFMTLHEAGHILQTPSAYPGAAAQGYNYMQKGLLGALPSAGIGIGGYLAGPMGGMVGSGIGGAASMVAKNRMDASMAAKLAEMLRNPTPQFPK